MEFYFRKEFCLAFIINFNSTQMKEIPFATDKDSFGNATKDLP